MKEYRLNKNNNFIDGYYLSDLSICDSLINLFEKSGNKFLGATSKGVNKKIKDSLDLPLNINNLTKELQSYFYELHKIIDLYKNKYKFCDKTITTWGIEEDFNIQRYKPSQAYHDFHCEKANTWSVIFRYAQCNSSIGYNQDTLLTLISVLPSCVTASTIPVSLAILIIFSHSSLEKTSDRHAYV